LGDVDVVVGVILNGDKFLVERRRLNESIDAGCVCVCLGVMLEGMKPWRRR